MKKVDAKYVIVKTIQYGWTMNKGVMPKDANVYFHMDVTSKSTMDFKFHLYMINYLNKNGEKYQGSSKPWW